MNIVTLLQEYQLYLVGVGIIIIIGCLKSDEFRNWVIRIVIFGLIITACYFGFQKIKYRFKSGNEVNPFNEQAEGKDHMGTKYYKDPAIDMKDLK